MAEHAEDEPWWETLVHRMGTAPATDTLEQGHDLYRASVQATRGLVLAEALLAIMIGFTADDLGLLRVPGYMVGLGLAVLTLAGGGLLHGHRLAARVTDGPSEDRARRLESANGRGRLIAVVTTLVFIAWLALFTLGVPPWAL